MSLSTPLAGGSILRNLHQHGVNGLRLTRQLSSGLRITSAADDAAGVAIADRLRARGVSLGRAQRNAMTGERIVDVADGAMNEIGHTLVRLRELAVQAASGDLGSGERGFLNAEMNELVLEVDRVARGTSIGAVTPLDGSLAGGSTSPATTASVSAATAQTSPLDKKEKLSFDDFGIFAGMSGNDRQIQLAAGLNQAGVVAAINGDPTIGALVEATVDGSGHLTLTSRTTGAAQQFRVSSNRAGAGDSTGVGTATLQGTGSDAVVGGALQLQVGVDTGSADEMLISLDGVTAVDLGIATANITSQENARLTIDAIDGAMGRLNNNRSRVGAYLNTLSRIGDAQGQAVLHTRAAESNIRDLDVASAVAEQARQRVVQQAATSVLAQANASGSLALQLL